MNSEEVRILVVDDVNAMRTQIRDLLRKFGFTQSKTAANAEAAKAMMELEDFHAFILDWHMTPTDGLELLKYIRIHDKYKNAPVIMLTAEGTKEQVMEAIKAGVDEYLLKPVTAQQVQCKIISVLLKKKVLQ